MWIILIQFIRHRFGSDGLCGVCEYAILRSYMYVCGVQAPYMTRCI